MDPLLEKLRAGQRGTAEPRGGGASPASPRTQEDGTKAEWARPGTIEHYVLNEINQRGKDERRVSCIGLAARLGTNEEAVANAIARLQDAGLVSHNLVVDDAPIWFRKRRRPRAKQLPLFEEAK